MTRIPDNMRQVMNRIAVIRTRLQEFEPRVTPSDGRTSFDSALQAAMRPSGVGRMEHAEIDELVAHAAAEYSLRPSLLRAVIQAESGFNPAAVSPKGAMGLMQLMPGTAAGLGVSDPFDPRQNIMGGARYLRQMLDRFGDESLALAAYNAGPGAVSRYAGVPPYAETHQYVARVLSLAGNEERH